MHPFALLLPVLALTSTCSAWAQDANGVWVANNNWHKIGGKCTLFLHLFSFTTVLQDLHFIVRVHESCTTMNTKKVHKLAQACAYWSDDKGGIFNGSMCYLLG
jgi:hypothetical protein